jgi:hypothetical protein
MLVMICIWIAVLPCRGYQHSSLHVQFLSALHCLDLWFNVAEVLSSPRARLRYLCPPATGGAEVTDHLGPY